MNDAEGQVRRLFALSTEDMPADIDLLRGVRGRRRLRTRVVLSTATTGVLAAVLVAALAGTTAVTLQVSRAPSALAAVIRAATRTAAQSYHYTATLTLAQAPAYGQPQRTGSAGEFDPVRRVGEESTSFGTRIRLVGGYLYFGSYKGPDGKPFDGEPWFRVPVHSVHAVALGKPSVVETTLIGSVLVYFQAGPQNLLALLRSASHVRETGRASGPGWTGVRYVFSGTTHSKSPDIITRFSGTVDVDLQGRVRQLDGIFTRSLALSGSTMLLTKQVAMSFGDFGAPVSVTAPPLSETAILAGQFLVPAG